MEHFGEHYMLDGYGGNREKLSNPGHIVDSVKRIAGELGMRCAMEPFIKHLPGNGIKDPGGYSAFVIIFESHISVHTFPDNGFVSIDVYTCKNGMDVQRIVEHFREAFDLVDTEENFVKRGLRYPGLV